MSKNDGGAAFPKAGLDPWGKAKNINIGMTLRDYMAIHASDSDIEQIMIENFDHCMEAYKVTRQQARYMHADAMLTERAK